MISHNNQKKIAVINDLSGFGRCSLTVALPIISHLQLQCCPLPTSIFSNHTGYERYYFDDYTAHMREYMENWKYLQLSFDGIATGFLGSKEQIRIVEEFMANFKTEHTKVVIDPVMGDNGSLYPTYTEDMCREMKKLIRYASILTPNLTEACLLSDTSYHTKGWRKEELCGLLERLHDYGANRIVISGIDMGQYIGNAIYDHGKMTIIRCKRVAKERAGTGDVFASILAADSVNHVDFETSVRKAAKFVQRCLLVTDAKELPPEDGVCFEEVLYTLKK